MKYKAISVIVIFSCILIAVQGNEINDEEFNVLHNAINSFTNVVVKYHTEFDTKVKFGSLQEVLAIVDKAMIGYQGTAKTKLDETRQLNSDAKLVYEDCVGPVFEWCVGINGTLDIIIKYLDDLELTNGDRDFIWNITVELVNQGQTKVSNSIELLKDVQSKMNDVKNLLDSMLHDMSYDFSPDGYYGKEITKFKKAIADERWAIQREQEELEERRRKALEESQRKYTFIDFIYETCKLFFDLIGHIFGRFRRTITSHIKTYEEKIKFIQEFFKNLNKKIKLASKIAAEINLSLTEDKKNLYALRGIIKTTDNNKQLMKLAPKLRAKLIPSFQQLGNKCYDYALWHGYGSKGYRHNHARARRQAIENCNTQRSKALTMITGSISSNVTFDPKNHFIFTEMNCGFTSPENEQPAVHLMHENSGPISIGGTTKKLLRSLSNPLQKKLF